jgi:hypothetical protein
MITAREPYTRKYLLMPQQTEREHWLEKLVPIVAYNYLTVGFSADDAGNGDGCSSRIVYAINPSMIGTGLTQEWFNTYYPGAQMIALTASSPDELLMKWRGA